MHRNKVSFVISLAGTLLAAGLAFGSGGIGDGTLPFHGRASLGAGATARLELRAAGEESTSLPCAGDVVSLSGWLELSGTSYPIRGACVIAGRDVRLEAATSAEPIKLQGRFDVQGFEGTLSWSGRAPAAVRFSVTP